MLKKAAIGLSLLSLVLASFSFVAPTYAEEAEPPVENLLTISNKEVSTDFTTVTVTTSVYAVQAPSVTDLEPLISVKRTGDTEFSALGEGDAVTFTPSGVGNPNAATLDITFASELTGETNAIRIAAGALVDETGAPYDAVTMESIVGRDVTPPSFVGAVSGGEEGEYYIELYFDGDLVANKGDMDEETFLRSKIEIATDGVNFEPLHPGDVGIDGDLVYIYYDYDIPVVVGEHTKIKIFADTIKDEADNLNAEMTLEVTPPVILSVETGNDYHDVTITFSEDIVDTTMVDGESALKNQMMLGRNGIQSSTEAGEVSPPMTAMIEGNQLKLSFEEPLAGTKNIVSMNPEAITDSSGNHVADTLITPPIPGDPSIEVPEEPEVIEGPDTSSPRLIDYYHFNGQDFVFVFDEEVFNNTGDMDSLKGLIQLNQSSLNTWKYLSEHPGAEISFTANTMTIHIAESFFSAIPESYVIFKIPQGTLRDASGNAQPIVSYIFWQEYFFPDQSIEIDDSEISNNGRWLTLDFNEEIEDHTLMEGISYLGDKISISTDRGDTFTALSDQDVVAVYGDRLVILFHDAIEAGTIQVKIGADAVSTHGGAFTNDEIIELVAYNTPEIGGYFFSNAASELVFEDNEEWRNSVTDIYVIASFYRIEGTSYHYEVVPRRLNPSEYTLTAGKLTMHPGVFEAELDYAVEVRADGYSSKFIGGYALPSSEIYYMTAPEIMAANGITAAVDVLYTLPGYEEDFEVGNQTIVFELMDGSTPVSIVAAELEVSSGTYRAHFNVVDAATNPNYSVKVFIVSEFNADSGSVGINMSKQVTQSEFDQMEFELDY